METSQLKCIIESALFSYGEPLTVARLLQMFDESEAVTTAEIRAVLSELTTDYRERGIELVEVVSGFRFQTQADVSSWIQKLGNERPPRYSRALLETLALIAYRQPITRAEIEAVRGVAVNTPTIKTLLERNWIQVAGYRDVPGKPALYATTKQFLDYFNLKNLSDLTQLTDVNEVAEEMVSAMNTDTVEAEQAA
jgi:segregation and condensation protein B